MAFLPQPKVKPGELTRAERKLQARTEDTEARRACYRYVDQRDRRRCRVCGTLCNPHATTLLERAHRHHLVFRSLGGDHDTRNVVLLDSRCHDDVHLRRTLRLSGNADLRNSQGTLSGVRVERLTARGWELWKFC